MRTLEKYSPAAFFTTKNPSEKSFVKALEARPSNQNMNAESYCALTPSVLLAATLLILTNRVCTIIQRSAFQTDLSSSAEIRCHFKVNVMEDSHPDKVKVYGPGVESGLKAGEPTYFTVDCSRAGSGDVSIGIKCDAGVLGPTERDVDFEIIKNDASDTFTVKYTPPGPGKAL